MILASWFRIYTATMSAVGIDTKICWTVNRGSDLSPVESCEGKLQLGHYTQEGTVVLVSGLKQTCHEGDRWGAAGKIDLSFQTLQYI